MSDFDEPKNDPTDERKDDSTDESRNDPVDEPKDDSTDESRNDPVDEPKDDSTDESRNDPVDEPKDDSFQASDLVEELRQSQEQYAAYRQQIYIFLEGIYAITRKLFRDADAQRRLFAEEYFQRTRVWEMKSRRDLYRNVLRYALNAYSNAEIKQASKYATVLWHLDEKKIPPDAAASTIAIFGGIEAIARHGIPDPVILDPRDVGDGMTATGEKIDYGDDEEEDYDGWEDDDEISDTENTDTQCGGNGESQPTDPDQERNQPESHQDESVTRIDTVHLRVTGSKKALKKLRSAQFGWEIKAYLTPVELRGDELLVEVRRVVLPKLSSWAGIRPIIRDDEEYYPPEEWHYPSELLS